MASEQNNIQDSFLNQLRKEREQVQITTTSGFKFKCRIKGFDRFSIMTEAGDFEQIVFKHAIAMISVKRGFSNKIKVQNVEAKDKKEDKQDDKKEDKE